MKSLDLVREIESAAYRCWPAAETVEYDGWLLRWAYGFSRRGNSVYPAEVSTLDHEAKLRWCCEWFQHRGLQLVVRQTPATEPGLDAILERLGYTAEGETDAMTAELGSEDAPYEIAAAPSTEWWNAMAGLWKIGDDRLVPWQSIIEGIELPAGYGLVVEDGDGVAAGLAVVDGSWLGLFEIIVAEPWQRRGIGERLTRSLMAWGRAQGAGRAFLQVVAENEPAIELYKGLGFARAYTYWYRRAPQD